jgi:hypothetical protein
MAGDTGEFAAFETRRGLHTIIFATDDAHLAVAPKNALEEERVRLK